MYFANAGASQQLNLQGVLHAASAGYEPFIGPHHPVSCMNGTLELDEENVLRCGHGGESHKGCAKVQSALDTSMSILLFEILYERDSKPSVPSPAQS